MTAWEWDDGFIAGIRKAMLRPPVDICPGMPLSNALCIPGLGKKVGEAMEEGFSMATKAWGSLVQKWKNLLVEKGAGEMASAAKSYAARRYKEYVSEARFLDNLEMIWIRNVTYFGKGIDSPEGEFVAENAMRRVRKYVKAYVLHHAVLRLLESCEAEAM